VLLRRGPNAHFINSGFGITAGVTVKADEKPKTTEEILCALRDKFASNLESSRRFASLATAHELNSRALSYIGKYLQDKEAHAPHQKAISSDMQELFGDLTCALYFAYIALDVPARTSLRRALELGLASVSHWDKPAEYYAWRDCGADISFAAILEYLTSPGYAKFFDRSALTLPSELTDGGRALRSCYSTLSNVVHPNAINLETVRTERYAVTEADLHESLGLLKCVQVTLIRLFVARFPSLRASLQTDFPSINV
jgi:hypothetical protein